MKFKMLLYPLLFFVLGGGVGVGGSYLLDYNRMAAQGGARSSPSIAQRVATLTPKATATTLPAETLEVPFIASPENSNSDPVTDVTPTLDAPRAGTITPTAANPITFTPSAARPPATARPNTPTPRATATVSGTVAATGPKGDSPFTAKEVAGILDKIPGNSVVWYKIGTETSYSLGMFLALDTNVDLNTLARVGFSVFSNEQVGDLNVLTAPKGRGAPNKILPMHALIWTGGSANAGIWYVLVKNDNPMPVEYKLTSTVEVKEHKNCRHYFEVMSNGVPIIWSACE